MSISGDRPHLKLVTVGDFDPQSDDAIEYDFIGRVIAGRYTVKEQLGGGGMADVFRATDEQLGIDVVIKLLKPRMASDDLRARMVQEARAAAQVRHDNLVRVFGTGMLDSTAYIVMELLDGPNLEKYLQNYRDQRMPWREALELLLPALDALHAVHERGYVHRDIKPGNILITKIPGLGLQPVVIDLGLVKPDRALRCATSPPTTEVGRILCTPGYTSPEQAAGLPVDRRSDVYSMGVTLYRVLAGRLPFHDARGQPVAVVLAKHINHEPTRLEKAAGDAHIPPAIAAVIESALRKLPTERPRTMLAFAEALRAAAASVPVHTERRMGARGALIWLGWITAFTWLARTLLFSPAIEVDPQPTAMHAPEDPLPAIPETPPVPAIHGPEDPLPAKQEIPETPPAPVLLDAELPGQPPLRNARIAGPTSPEPATRPSPLAAWHRALRARTPDVQRCADEFTGSVARLSVTVNVDTTGHIVAHVAGVPDNPLSRCIARVVTSTPLTTPRKPASFVHVFAVRVTPPEQR